MTAVEVCTPKEMNMGVDVLIDGSRERKYSNKRRSSIADDLMLDILSRVPARSLVRFRCVCKLWNSLFRDSHFIRLQLRQAAKNPATFIFLDNYGRYSIYPFKIKAGEIVLPYSKFMAPMKNDSCVYRISNACDGLIAFYHWARVYVVNPTTREWISPPMMSRPMMTPHKPPLDQNMEPSVGLGFCTATGKYKLVRIFCGDHVVLSCELLTLGTDRSWRPVGVAPCCVAYNFIPTYANGFIYWTIAGVAEIAHNDVGSMGILAFDVCKEKFTMEISLPMLHTQPQPFGKGVYRRLCVSTHEGSLCLIDWRVYSGSGSDDHLDEARLSYLSNQDSAWKEIGSIKVPKSNRIWTPLLPNLSNFRVHGLFPVAIQQGMLILNCPFFGWWGYDLRTGASSKINLHVLNDRIDIQNRTIPFACAQTIIPLHCLDIL